MHCLFNTFVSEAKPVKTDDLVLYPVKITLAKDKTRFVYFESKFI